MFEISVTVKNAAILRRLIDKVAKQGSRMQQLMRQTNDKYKPQIIAMLSAEPPPSQGNVPWTSEAQRITVLAILRAKARAAGRSDIRYIRTHDLSRGYLVEVVPGEKPNEFGIQVSNPTRYAVYVKWKWQQGFHKKTGWIRDDAYLQSMQEQMAEDFADRAVTEFKELG